MCELVKALVDMSIDGLKMLLPLVTGFLNMKLKKLL